MKGNMKSLKARFKKVYSSLEEFIIYDRYYNIVKRCGYKSAKKLWKDNPMIGGGTNPKDFGIVKKYKS